MTSTAVEKAQALETLEQVAQGRKDVDLEVARYREVLMHGWKARLAPALAQALNFGVAKRQIGIAYGTKDPHTINRLIAELTTLDGTGHRPRDLAPPPAAPAPAPTHQQGATATPAQQDPPPLTRSDDAPSLEVTGKSEGFVTVTLRDYPHPHEGHPPVSVEDYRFSYSVRQHGNLPPALSLRTADDRPAPEGLGAVRIDRGFRAAVAEAAGIEV